MGSPKTAGNEQVCAHQKFYSKFSEIFFQQLYTGRMDCSSFCHIAVIAICRSYCGFSLLRQMAPQQVNFVPVWGRIASPIIHRFGRCFQHLLRDQMFFATH